MNILDIYKHQNSNNFDPYKDKSIVLVEQIEFDLNTFDGKTLNESIQELNELNKIYDGNTMLGIWKTEGEGYYGTPVATLYIYRSETDQEFKERLNKYKKKVKDNP